ncbi:hypothetical protein [Brevibacterium picturae]|uniref:Uncharacterized protein n=1 Tax=Brevibacterium picturae TaxID=260553 RepID=A0ABP4MD74_9MICO
MSDTIFSSGIVPLWDMVGGPMPRGVLGLGDPDVHVLDGIPTMFLGGFSSSFRNRLYVATLAPEDDPAHPSWSVDLYDRGRARTLAPDPPKDAWDSEGMHTPSFVPAVGDQPARIYYTGRASRKQYGPRSSYAIGALELIGGEWVRREEPLIRGVAPRSSVLEPLVMHDRGRYVMWFQANPHEIGPGELPNYELRVAESSDGVSWSDPQVFATPEEGFFDNAVARTKDGWLMVLARGSDLHSTGEFPAQGLWVSTARELSTDRAEWSGPRHVLNTGDSGMPAFLARGVYGPGILHNVDRDRTVVYVTGVREAPKWPVLLARRIIHGQRPVVPSPFYLSVAAIELGD